MGTENIWLIIILGFMAFVANSLYAMGGTEGFGKWLRRYLASFILAVAANGAAIYLTVWTWQYIFIYPCLIGGFSLGYGANTTWEKILKRGIFALGVLTACFCGFWATGATILGWIVVGLAFLTGVTSVVLGVINPFNNAPLEQFIICQVLCLYIPYWAFLGKVGNAG